MHTFISPHLSLTKDQTRNIPLIVLHLPKHLSLTKDQTKNIHAHILTTYKPSMLPLKIVYFHIPYSCTEFVSHNMKSAS